MKTSTDDTFFLNLLFMMRPTCSLTWSSVPCVISFEKWSSLTGHDSFRTWVPNATNNVELSLGRIAWIIAATTWVC